MRILIVHNSYRLKGGEDVVVADEVEILRQNGHVVEVFSRDNTEIRTFFDKLFVFLFSVLNPVVAVKFFFLLMKFRPDVIHVHNMFPMISPSVIVVAKLCNIPVVMTLHNFRLICPTTYLFLNGEMRDDSLRGNVFWALGHRPYQNSYVGTFALCIFIEFHKRLKTWNYFVDKFIVLSSFSKDLFVKCGFDEAKFVIKPNSSTLPVRAQDKHEYKRGVALFVGRLSPEKGIKELVEVWKSISFPLYIVGDGPLHDQLVKMVGDSEYIKFCGRLGRAALTEVMRNSSFLIVPSIWPEAFGLVVIEAFAQGVPAIVSDRGALPELVSNGECGIVFRTDESGSLSLAIKYAIDNPNVVEAMGARAKEKFETCYSREVDYLRLYEIFLGVLRAKY